MNDWCFVHDHFENGCSVDAHYHDHAQVMAIYKKWSMEYMELLEAMDE